MRLPCPFCSGVNYLMPLLRGVRRAGAAALDIAWTAAGQVDGYWEAGLWPWDWASGALLVIEAGGVVTGYAGNPWKPGTKNLLAANPILHNKLLESIQNARYKAGFQIAK